MRNEDSGPPATLMHMTGRRLLVYDDGMGRWGPLCDLRAIFDCRTGAQTTIERIERVMTCKTDNLAVPPALAAVTAARHPAARVNQPLPPNGSWLVINGRCVAPAALKLARHLPLGKSLVQANGELLASHLTVAAVQTLLAKGFRDPFHDPKQVFPERALAARPWHLLEALDANLRDDLAASEAPPFAETRPDVSRLGDNALLIAAEARIHPMAVFNMELGPIVVDRQAIIGAFAVLAGPCYIGPGSVVAPHTHVRPYTVTGPRCMIAGEVAFSIIQGFSNKAHTGYLGHSLVGEWVNLGADTNVSNLKNTYGSIRVPLNASEPPEDSGQVKLGPVIGDFVRTAIGSRLTTGSCVGTGSMLALSGFTPKFVARLRFVTDVADEPYDIHKFLATARQMLARRKMELPPATEARLRELSTERSS